jgi:hypothetical protein
MALFGPPIASISLDSLGDVKIRHKLVRLWKPTFSSKMERHMAEQEARTKVDQAINQWIYGSRR